MTSDLLEIAKFIQSTMCEYIHNSQYIQEQRECEEYVFEKLMKFTKNHMNPRLAFELIKLHKKPMIKAGYKIHN